jgi:diguanylate cyclase (GGDEF)-like protein/PAS domain S-box-containing protein
VLPGLFGIVKLTSAVPHRLLPTAAEVTDGPLLQPLLLASRAMAIARMGYWVIEARDPTTFWMSEELAALMDVPAGFVPIATVRERYHGDGAARVAAALQRCLSDGTPYVVDVTCRHPDGRDFSLRIHGEAERDGAGAIVRIIGIVTDETSETQALEQVAASEQRLADFLDTATDWCWQTDAEHRFERFEAGSATRSIDVRLVIGKRRWDLDIPESSRPELEAVRAEMEARRPFRNLDYTVNTRIGPRRARTSGKPMFDADGTFLGYRGTTSDITELRETERLLLKRSAALAEAHRLGRMGSWSYLLGGTSLTWSDELFSVTGFDPATFDSSNEAVLALFMPEDREKLLDVQRAVLREGGAHSCDVRLCCADGRIRDFAVTCKGEELGGKVVGFVGTVQDVTERKQAQRQLEELAYADSLTGLANRAMFKQALTKVIGKALLEGHFATLYLVDLDRFKEVNDAFGHAAGDELLCRVAAILRREFGDTALIARLGGDEFAVLTERAHQHEDVRLVADDLIQALSGPIDLSSGEAFVGATIGVALLPEHATSTDQAMRHADLALYTGKEAGRGRSMLFESAFAAAVEQRLLLARDLRHAIEEQELHAVYQPQVCISSGRVIGFEALLRWTHRERGPISPGVFIPVAENSGIIVDLGLWILREACRQAKAWLDQGLPPRTMSVNVSPAQFWAMDFGTAVAAVLAETGLPPELLCLELTESLFVDQSEERVSRTLSALSRLGIKLALDDFGSGYSSLGYLTRLPFHRLKVDRSFVDGIASDPAKRKLLAGIIALSRGLGLATVAEGAEKTAEVDVLRDVGCDSVQGFVYSRPVGPDAATAVAASIEAEPLPDRRAPCLVPGTETTAMVAALA